eukprot:TRINITY_DN25268_c0_g1_i1.p1 TRINITY_DN25268_c0_g1~~TRINITY_DN25268_c0_g1_i1.p1  ORF type:complete len:172 (-),score=13.56 TRINITY_DN25268_c0_g1_i1:257-772(-)
MSVPVRSVAMRSMVLHLLLFVLSPLLAWSSHVAGSPGAPLAWDSKSGKLSIKINGMPAQAVCWVAQSAEGLVATLSGAEGVVVYDPDAPCGNGGAFIHYAGSGDFVPMAADAGKLVHRYIAGAFGPDIVEHAKFALGTCAADFPGQGVIPLESTSWKVSAKYRGMAENPRR